MKRPYVDDSEVTEIIIQPDWRIYVFGLSVEVAGVLEELKREAAKLKLNEESAGTAGAEAPGADATGPSTSVTLRIPLPDGAFEDTGYNDKGGMHGEG
jgi:hypothetical protein